MNFHKTIGYLAALLLMLGIGVPDSFAQDLESISLSVSPRTLRDSTSATDGVTVTATVSVKLAEAITVGGVPQVVSVDITTALADESADQTADSYRFEDGTIELTVAGWERFGK